MASCFDPSRVFLEPRKTREFTMLKAESHSNGKENTFDWLKCCTQNMPTFIQPIEGGIFNVLLFIEACVTGTFPVKHTHLCLVKPKLIFPVQISYIY